MITHVLRSTLMKLPLILPQLTWFCALLRIHDNAVYFCWDILIKDVNMLMVMSIWSRKNGILAVWMTSLCMRMYLNQGRVQCYIFSMAMLLWLRTIPFSKAHWGGGPQLFWGVPTTTIQFCWPPLPAHFKFNITLRNTLCHPPPPPTFWFI